jgi:hypothetical protein
MIRPYTKAMQADGGRVKSKAARKAAEDKELRATYRLVDQRDGGRCRVCQARVSSRGGLVERAIHHHLIYRSRIGVSAGRHASWNVALICARCDADIHVEGTLHLEGDADQRSAEGQLCGIKVTRFTDGEWKVEPCR